MKRTISAFGAWNLSKWSHHWRDGRWVENEWVIHATGRARDGGRLVTAIRNTRTGQVLRISRSQRP